MFVLLKRFCQLALWGATVQPSSKQTSCKNQLASTLLTTTGNLTASLGNTLSNILPGRGSGGGIQSNQMGGTMSKQTDKSSAATANNKHGNGILGVGIL